MSERHVLIVEDNFLNMTLFTDVLEMNGWAVHQATDVDEARAALDQHERLELVLADISLEGEEDGGGQVLSMVRERPRFAKTLVVALTAFAMRGDRERFLERGFDGYISKPIDVRTFAATVDEICAG